MSEAISPSATPSARPHARHGASLHFPRTILLIEDDVELRRLLTTTLERDGYDVVPTASGEEALDWLGLCLVDGSLEHVPALIVSDLRLPDLSGLEVVEGLRAAVAAVPVILITGFPSEETYAEAFALGAARMLAKPFDLDELRLAVYTTLEAQMGLPSLAWRPRRNGWTKLRA